MTSTTSVDAPLRLSLEAQKGAADCRYKAIFMRAPGVTSREGGSVKFFEPSEGAPAAPWSSPRRDDLNRLAINLRSAA